MRKPRISVVMPVYNVEAYLPEAIASVQQQSIHDWEIIGVDDASTDRSLQLLHQFSLRDHRIRCIPLPENHGVSYARNRALQEARGDYICFLDPDDYLLPGAFASLLTCADAETLDGILFDAGEVYASPRLERKLSGQWQGQRQHTYPETAPGYAMYLLLAKKGDYSSLLGRSFWRLRTMQEAGIRFSEELKLAEDDLFYFQMMLAARRVRVLPERFYVYRRREASLTVDHAGTIVDDFSRLFLVHQLRKRTLESSESTLPRDAIRELYASEKPMQTHLLGLYHRMTSDMRRQMTFGRAADQEAYQVLQRVYQERMRFTSMLQRLIRCGEPVYLIGDENGRDAACRWLGQPASAYRCIYDSEKHVDGGAVLTQMHQHPGVYIFFTVVYDLLLPLLSGDGFQEDRDFFDGRMYLF